MYCGDRLGVELRLTNTKFRKSVVLRYRDSAERS